MNSRLVTAVTCTVSLLAGCGDGSGPSEPAHPPQVVGEYEAVQVDGVPLPLELGPMSWCGRDPNWQELRRIRLTLEPDSTVEVWQASRGQCGGNLSSTNGTTVIGSYSVSADGAIELTATHGSARGRFTGARVIRQRRIEMSYSSDPDAGQPWYVVVLAPDGP
jgi:hypothetical protein